jgi:hypothetical protein
VAYLRFTRDARGYENTYLIHTSAMNGKPVTRILYWFRTPPNVRVGRVALDEGAVRQIEELHPDLEFDWPQILKTTIPSAPAGPFDGFRRPRRPGGPGQGQKGKDRARGPAEGAAGSAAPSAQGSGSETADGGRKRSRRPRRRGRGSESAVSTAPSDPDSGEPDEDGQDPSSVV